MTTTTDLAGVDELCFRLQTGGAHEPGDPPVMVPAAGRPPRAEGKS